ncbi:MAG: hypothetical protein ABIG37_00855 [Nanoarchaeota archaeon]
MIKNKKGEFGGWGIAITIIALVIVGYIIYAFASPSASPKQGELGNLQKIFDASNTKSGNTKIPLPTEETKKTPLVFILKYVVGMHNGILTDLKVKEGKLENLSIRGMMILIATWVIFLVVFTDLSIVIGSFSHKMVGFLVGLGVTVIMANFGMFYWLFIWLMGIYAFAAGLSVFLVLLSILFLGVGAHFGITPALNAIKRKREIWDIQTGAEKAGAGAKAAKKFGEDVSE